MLLGWFDARRATEVAIVLADEFASATTSGPLNRGGNTPVQRKQGDALRDFLRRAEREVGALQLNFYKKAKLANSFKWRLLEKGVESAAAAEATQTLVMHLSMNRLAAAGGHDSSAAPTDVPAASKTQDLLARATACMSRDAYAEAVTAFEAFIAVSPRHAVALNNLGASLCNLGRFKEAEPYFRRAIGIKPNYPDAHANLGALLRAQSNLAAAENSLRRALKLNPGHLEARTSLGSTLLAAGRPADAKFQFDKALKASPRHTGALLGVGQVATMQGRFSEAETLFKQVLEIDPNAPGAWTGLVGLRKMTSADSTWLQRAAELADSGIAPSEQINLRFAIGKYCDDVADFTRAFRSYQRANELLKANAEPYDRESHTRFVDDLIRVHTRATVAAAESASASDKPVLVVGMPRSGTSLVEQIIASHPAAAGAGELFFWTEAMQRHEVAIRQGTLNEPLKKKLAGAYLQVLARHGRDALRTVDKAPINADYLGIIHSVFPRARIIYVRRNPIDTCLSCFFQQFSAGLNFTLDLADLAHYYRQHHRLLAHWRTVLPPGAMLNVPYEELVADQEGWTRQILDHLGLEWDQRCLAFQDTARTVATASAWQVRQKIYSHSVQRWRHYEKFIGPLRDLQELDA